MQCARMTYRAPLRVLCGAEYACGCADFVEIGAHGFEDGADLAGVDAPHAQKTEILAGAPCVIAYGVDVIEFGGYVVSGNGAVGQGGGNDFSLGAYQHGVGELQRAAHGGTAQRAVMGGHEIHYAEIQ